MKTVDQVEKQTAVALTRKEKLLRWADLVRAQPNQMYIFHMLEHWDQRTLNMSSLAQYWGGNPASPNVFSLAASDPVFKAAGLKGDSVAASMEFFSLSQEDIHAFSCNCGGHISNREMADRIEGLANPPAKRPLSYAEAFRSVFSRS